MYVITSEYNDGYDASFSIICYRETEKDAQEVVDYLNANTDQTSYTVFAYEHVTIKMQNLPWCTPVKEQIESFEASLQWAVPQFFKAQPALAKEKNLAEVFYEGSYTARKAAMEWPSGSKEKILQIIKTYIELHGTGVK